MARAFPQPAYQPEPQPGEWQALRGELVALLDEVEGQVARVAGHDNGYEQLSERMRDLRFQVAEDAQPPDRRREALRSVQRAVDRFHDRDDAGFVSPNPRDNLQSAISQIRSRRDGPMAAARQFEPEPHGLGELSRAVNAIAQRLERVEGEIKTQGRANGSVKDIADQVAQLAHVVELLAGAVGEAGQVKRLEGQIAGLAKLVTKGPQTDLSALLKRFDDVSATVGRLAELQVQYGDRMINPAQSAVFKDGMQAIEASVRNVYDRIDTIERGALVSPEQVEHLSAEMARFTEALSAGVSGTGASPPQNMIELLDALNLRIADIENQEGVVGGLRADIEALREAVIGAIEPRFHAIESRLGTLTDRLGTGGDNGIGQLEVQVRQLVARMDQTGEQLSGLAKLYSRPAETAADFDALADLVAAKTSEAMAQRDMPNSADPSADGLRALEARMTELFQSASAAKPRAEFTEMQAGIRQVNDRLVRLEASLLKAREETNAAPHEFMVDAEPLAPPAAAVQPEAAAPAKEPFSAPAWSTPRRNDAMPANPNDEAPLMAPAFPDAMPVQAALEVKNGPRKRHPGLDRDDLMPEAEMAGTTQADVTPMALPPAPRSSLGAVDDNVFSTGAHDAAAEAVAQPPASTESRNTFIEAARRAAQRQSPARTEASANSLIGRALARFQSVPAATAEPAPVEAETRPAKRGRVKAEKAVRRLPGDEPTHVQWTPEPAPPTPEDHAAATLPDSVPKPSEEGNKSFLRRHSKIILLAVGLVALAFLTLQLVMQRISEFAPDSAEIAAPVNPEGATPADVVPSPTDNTPMEKTSSLTAPPRIIPMVDSLATGSIDAGAAQGFVATPGPQDMPTAFKAAETEAAGEPGALPVLPELASSPVKVEMPPDKLGPIELRQSAADGDARAQFEIAAIYTEGRAVPQDLAAAATWYERAAAQGFAPAQYRLGTLYESGDGVAKDLEQARLWYQRAAEEGNRMSMHNLAALYAGGLLGSQDFDSAAKWFEEAASRDMTDSQFNLGMLYARGLGVPQSLEDSYKWFALAAAKGDKDAAKSRDDVARSLDSETVNRMNTEIAAWTPAAIDLAANFAPLGTWSKQFDPGETIASKDIVKSVQGALQRLGFDVGTPDGVSGPKTAEAIRAFERATGMSPSGAINPRLLAVLGSQPA